MPDGSAGSGGSAGQGGSAGASGSAGSAGSGATGGADAGDAGSTCDPLQQTGCASGQRCTWITTDASGNGHVACLPDGNVDLGGACSTGAPGETTGYDNCKKGLGCLEGICETLCDPSATNPCAGGYSCTTYAGLYTTSSTSSNVGFCEPGCDPLTQKSGTGAPACGSPDPSSPTLGCYQWGTSFTCGPIVDASKTQGTTPAGITNGQPPANGCAPGYMPFFADFSHTSYICTAFCKPGPTSASNTANFAGLVGSGETCPTPLPGNSYECRYWQYFEDHTQAGFPDPYSNTLGLCIDPAQYLYDSNGDGTPDKEWPTCTQLSDTAHNFDSTLTDTQYWGCTPYP